MTIRTSPTRPHGKEEASVSEYRRACRKVAKLHALRCHIEDTFKEVQERADALMKGLKEQGVQFCWGIRNRCGEPVELEGDLCESCQVEYRELLHRDWERDAAP